MAQFIAIDADAQGMFVVAATLRGTAIVLDRAVHFENLPPLTTATAVELGMKLREWLKSAEIRPAPVLFAIGRDKVILKEVRHPPAPPAEEMAVVRFQAVKDLTESPDDVVMDYTPLPESGTGERRASVVFARKDVLAAARTLCETAGLRLTAVTPRPFVAAALLRHAAASGDVPAAQTASALVSLWPGGGELTIVRGSDVLFSRAVPSAIQDERMLTSELRRNFAIYDSQHAADPIGAVYVSEAYGHREGWTDRLADVLTLPIHRLDPLAGSPVSETVPPASHGRFAAPVGMLAAQANGGLAINLASKRQPRTVAKPTRRKVLVGVFVAAFALLSVGLLGALQLYQADRRLTAANLAATHLDEQLQQHELDGKRLAAADEFTNREVVWLDELYDLSDRLPDIRKMRVTEVDGTATQPAKTTGPGKAAALPKGAKPPPVASLRVVVSTDEPALLDKLIDAVNRDGFYATTTKTTAGTATASSRMQQFTVASQVLHRGPADYRRLLTVSAPPVPPPPPPPPPPSPSPSSSSPTAAPKPTPIEFDFEGFNP